MSINPLLTRQLLGCGYEPPPPAPFVVEPWEPPRTSAGFDGDPVAVCAGYTTRLPEVFEAMRARHHWTKGQLESFCEGPPSEHLMMAIEILDSSSSSVERYGMTAAKDGGGRE